MLVRVADRRPGRILACLDLDFAFTHIPADPNPWLCGNLLYHLLRTQPRCRLLVVSTLLVGEGSRWVSVQPRKRLLRLSAVKDRVQPLGEL